MVGSRVYVGGLPYRTTERDLERFFKSYGRMRDVLIKNGYGFVEFDDYRDADDAVYELNGKKLLGERVTVERARGTPRGRDQWSMRSDHRSHERYGPPARTNYRVIIENLSSRVSWQDLKDYMRQAGEVTYADAHKEHRNQGVVEFASYSDMKNAIEKLDDTDLNGRKIKVVQDKRSRKHSSSSRSKSGSRSRSRSRSPVNGHGSKSRSRSASRGNSRSDSREKSVERSDSQSPRNEKRSPSREKSRSRSRSVSKSKSRSRSAD
ncbi:serine-arginine protein 55-like [Photinus pyralis]|uniref:RRM domain-containing protein n=1 Tax=Photinus pyralis TaxID=7054 RepID=A0A1Y1L1P2_PHOPY|nr:serine-arginine protein 55-like [Photinus pyralis]